MSGTGQGQRSAEEDKENRAEQRREMSADVEREERRVVLGPKRRVELGEECRVEERWPLCCTRRGVRLYDPRGWRPVVCSVV